MSIWLDDLSRERLHSRNLTELARHGADITSAIREITVADVKASADGHDISQITSVASFFVSRVDTEIDKRLEANDSDTPMAATFARAGYPITQERVYVR